MPNFPWGALVAIVVAIIVLLVVLRNGDGHETGVGDRMRVIRPREGTSDRTRQVYRERVGIIRDRAGHSNTLAFYHNGDYVSDYHTFYDDEIEPAYK